MNYRRVVITCGVSVFSASNAPRKWIDEHALLTVPPGGIPNPSPPVGSTDIEALEQMARQLHSLPVPAEPERFSAEYTALHALRKDHRLDRAPEVVLVHTHSLGGRAAARILAKAMSRDFDAQVKTVEVHLNVNDRAGLRLDLGRFLHAIAGALKGHDPAYTCFAPLGGYKVMTSMAYLAGAFFGYPAVYVHEDNQTLHDIPAVPIRVPAGELIKAKPALIMASDGCELGQLSDGARLVIEEYPWMFEVADEYVFVNAFGHFLMLENEALFAPSIHVAAHIERTVERERRLRDVARKLAEGSTDTELTHEGALGLHSRDGWHVLKLPRSPVRAIYRYMPAERAMQVKWLTEEHGDNSQYVDKCKAAWDSEPRTMVEWKSS